MRLFRECDTQHREVNTFHRHISVGVGVRACARTCQELSAGGCAELGGGGRDGVQGSRNGRGKRGEALAGAKDKQTSAPSS